MINPILSTLAAITLASPAIAGIHDFTPANSASTRARAGQGQCVTTRDQSRVCYIKTTASDYSIAIRDVDHPGVIEAAHINCSTGRWHAYGDLPKSTVELYLNGFCNHY